MAGELEALSATVISVQKILESFEKRLEINEAKVKALQPVLDAHLAAMPDAPTPVSPFNPNASPPDAAKE